MQCRGKFCPVLSPLVMVALTTLFSVLMGLTSAFAQNQNDFMNVFTGIMRPVANAAQAEWQKLPQNELSCSDQALHQRGSDLRTVIQKGIMPSDARIADIRAVCSSFVHETVGATR
jgi:hypothetical protein